MSARPRVPQRVEVRAYGLTDAGQKRANNEDAFIIADLARIAEEQVRDRELALDATAPNAVLLAVSDGMGGANAGEVASALVVDSLRRAMKEAASGDWNEATRKAVEHANSEVFAAASAPDRRGMGATLTAVCIHAGEAHVAAVGDSRAYLLRGDRMRQVTKDQSFVQYLVDAGAIAADAAADFAMKNVVLQAMGQKADVAVALGRLELRRGDRLLLCSDGLSNKLTAEDMQAVLERAPSLPAACWEMVELANARGGDDNITVVLAEVDGAGVEPADAQASLTRTFHVLAEYKASAGDLGMTPDEEEETSDLRIVPLLAPVPAGQSISKPAADSPRPGPVAEAPAKAAGGRRWLAPVVVSILALLGLVVVALVAR